MQVEWVKIGDWVCHRNTKTDGRCITDVHQCSWWSDVYVVMCCRRCWTWVHRRTTRTREAWRRCITACWTWRRRHIVHKCCFTITPRSDTETQPAGQKCTRSVAYFICLYFLQMARVGWLGSRVVSVLDSGAEGPGFKSQPRHCQVTVLCKLFTPIVPLFTKQRNW